MGRKPLSTYPPDVAARMRAEISEKNRQAWAAGKYATRVNAATREDVKVQIAASVRAAWADGRYEERANGMADAYGSANPGWCWGKHQFAEIAKQFHGGACLLCGTTENIDVHHFDEDHDNYLLSNLAPLCVPCHLWRFHYRDRGETHRKRPFVSATKRFRFEYAHVLPWHPGKCGRVHGHSGHMSVTIRGRLDPNGVVEDFFDIAAATKAAVVDPLDHQLLNDFLTNPTSEEFVTWAWQRLETIGLKGLQRVAFSETDSSEVEVTKEAVLECFGWDRAPDGTFVMVAKDVS